MKSSPGSWLQSDERIRTDGDIRETLDQFVEICRAQAVANREARGRPTGRSFAVEISCSCGWYVEEVAVSDRVAAELVAERHVERGWRRPYRIHDTQIRELEVA